VSVCVFRTFEFMILNLFRISDFEFRILHYLRLPRIDWTDTPKFTRNNSSVQTKIWVALV
jgi:hypothetical protein